MATLQDRNGSFRILFCHRGKRHTATLGKVSRCEAEGTVGQFDLLLLRIKQNLIHVPPGDDISEFLLRGGKPPEADVPAAPEPITFRRFKERYLEAHGGGAMEENSLATVRMHLGHVERTLGERFPLASLATADLQRHIDHRRKAAFRGRPLRPVTLRKEMASFRAAWNWAAHLGLVRGPFPGRGLVYPKADEKLPFMTWPEVERKVTSAMTEAERAGLWDCVYLRKGEIDELLVYAREHGTQPWVYPLLCAAAYTGARRSELLRIEVGDVNFDEGTLLIREKKRSRKQRTTRHVSLAPSLKGVLRAWLAVHPGGRFLFCQDELVPRSKKRSRTTGHKGQRARATTLGGRMGSVRARQRPGLGALTKDEAHDHFRRTLAGSKWSVLRGYHVLRHSFISCLAAAGVDQRIIDDFVGHQTDEQRRRYRHLYPDVKQRAIAGVFG
jgi:integrase